jgi:hypothetical protein
MCIRLWSGPFIVMPLLQGLLCQGAPVHPPRDGYGVCGEGDPQAPARPRPAPGHPARDPHAEAGRRSPRRGAAEGGV